MAERNWRDEFEEIMADGFVVKDVWYQSGNPVAVYAHAPSDSRCDVFKGVRSLIPKPKPKTYRPWTRDEVPVGAVIKNKTNGFRGVIVGVASCTDMVRVSDASYSTKQAFEIFTMLDGTPCGVQE